MKATIADSSGFCFGVKRAIEIAETSNQGVILGNLVHNANVVNELRRKGFSIKENIDEIDSGNVIITAHGVADSVKEKAIKKKLNVIDATCPLVKKVHDITKQLEKDGYLVVIIGEQNHIEVKGIAGNLKNCVIINSEDEAYKIKNKRIGVVSQTTQEAGKFNRILSILKKNNKEIFVSDTICLPTKQRQISAEELSRKADMMIVIGGRNSSNAKRLYEICRKNTEALWVENVNELKKECFKGKKHIGITAGASTPEYDIIKVRDFIEGL